MWNSLLLEVWFVNIHEFGCWLSIFHLWLSSSVCYSPPGMVLWISLIYTISILFIFIIVSVVLYPYFLNSFLRKVKCILFLWIAFFSWIYRYWFWLIYFSYVCYVYLFLFIYFPNFTLLFLEIFVVQKNFPFLLTMLVARVKAFSLLLVWLKIMY